jgi:hypothetical protein
LSWGLAGLITFAAPWFLAVPKLRAALVRARGGDPGFLAELTLWEPLVEAARGDPSLALWAATVSPPPGCPEPYALASLRWYWTAQLAFASPGQPRAYSLDFNHLSYYAFRDDLSELAGCPVLILADRRHLDRALLDRAVATEREATLRVPQHGATPVVALMGRFRSAAELTALPEPAATFR